MDGSNTGHLTVECACGRRLKAPASAAGKRAKCPGCGTLLTIEAPPPPEEGVDNFDALYELAAQESEAANRPETASSSSMRCPSCTSALAPGAVICVQCGFDLRTQSKVKPKANAPEKPEPAAKKGKAARATRETSGRAEGLKGNYFLGIGFGTAAAISAAAICYFVWLKAPEIPFTGWLALLVGAAAGFGVNEGYKAGTHFAGATAAAITLLVVILTKVAVIAAVVAPVVDNVRTRAVRLNRDPRVLETLVEKEMKARNMSRDHATFVQMTHVRDAAEKQLQEMPDDEYEAAVKSADEAEERQSLISILASEELASHPDSSRGASMIQIEAAHEIAKKRVDAMSPADRTALLAAKNKQTEAEYQQMRAKWAEKRAAAATMQAAAKEEEALDPESSTGSHLLGFALIMVVVFFLWSMLPSFVAMALAWKIAADA